MLNFIKITGPSEKQIVPIAPKFAFSWNLKSLHRCNLPLTHLVSREHKEQIGKIHVRGSGSIDNVWVFSQLCCLWAFYKLEKEEELWLVSVISRWNRFYISQLWSPIVPIIQGSQDVIFATTWTDSTRHTSATMRIGFTCQKVGRSTMCVYLVDFRQRCRI